ncbi:MAG: DnaT-like ssDNA-binding protein [Burkholderiales bacterium]
MTLIVEDGSIVANANSYVSLVDARAYALARQFVLPVGDVILEAYLIQAMDYLESKRFEYQGSKVDPALQTLQWPRQKVKIDCQIDFFPIDKIPLELKQAQSRLAVELTAGTVLFPTKPASFVVREKIGPIETEYSEKIGIFSQQVILSVDALLLPLFSACGSKFALYSIRV